MTKKRRRRIQNYWIFPKLQRLILIWALVIPTLVTAGFGALLYIPTRLLVSVLMDHSGNGTSAMIKNVTDVQNEELYWVLWMALTCFAGFAFLVLVLSHRIAGPIHQMVRVLREARSGNLSARVVLRKGDLLEGLAEEMNQYLDHVQRRTDDANRD